MAEWVRPWLPDIETPVRNLPRPAFVSLGKTLHPHYLSPPRSINGYLRGLRKPFVNELAPERLTSSRARNTPQGVEVAHNNVQA